MGLAAALAVLPIVVATGRALHRAWFPMGDNAYFTIRARDVLTEHHPLVGAWSSGSASVGVEVNNLGPLQLDLLAVPVRLLGAGPGTAIGVALVNALACTTVVVLFHRRLGALGAWVGAAAAVATAWTLGSELLFEPRQHHALVLPFLAFLVAAWAAVAGDRWSLPAAVAWGTLVAQTHLTFALPVALVTAFGALALVAAHVTGRAPAWGRRRWWATGVVAAGLWAQPVVEELRPGQGNLSALREAAGVDQEPYGLSGAVRATADVLLPPSGWWRGSFRAFDPATALPSLGAAVVGMGVVGLVLAAVLRAARRRGDAQVVALVVVVAVALAAGLLGAARSPVDGPFGAVPGNFRFLWPLGVLTSAAVVVGALRAARPRTQRRASVAVAVVTGALVLASVPTSYQSPGPEADAELIPVARSLVDQLGQADVDGPVQLQRGGLYFGEPYTYVVVWALVDHGVEVVFDDPVDQARFGESRAPERNPPVAAVVRLVAGDAVDEAPPGTVLARASLLTREEQEELAELRTLTDPSPRQRARRDVLLDRHQRGTVAVLSDPR